MQVSWIEADDLKDLLARITPDEPAAAPVPRSWDIMPSVDPATAASFIITADEPFLKAEPQEPFTSAPEQEVPLAKEVPEHPASLAPEPALAPEAGGPEDPPAPSPAALPLSRIRDKLRAIRQRANEAGILTKAGDSPSAPLPAPEVKAPPAPEPPASLPPWFEVPTGGRQERLAAFAGWTRRILHQDGGHLLVMNDEGELLWGGEAKAGMVLSAMLAWGATLRSSAAAACGSLPVLHQTLASGHVLTAIPCETVNGLLLHAAVVGPARVPDEIAMQLRQGLIRAAGSEFA
ncbi:MAG: hypothetical protein ACO1TE_28830 [Prosthecobacter sp.]